MNDQETLIGEGNETPTSSREYTDPRTGTVLKRAATVESRHTPGPWYSSRRLPASDGNPLGQMAVGDGIDCLALLNPDIPRSIAEANARLIASAPELLAALRECLLWIETPTRPWAATADQARAAIAKATGGAK